MEKLGENKMYASETQNSEVKSEKNMELIEKLKIIICLHEKMRNSFFWTPPSNACGRRAYEERNSLETKFVFKGDTYEVIQKTECSCKNIYYSVKYKKNDEIIKADIRLIKKILKIISA